MLSRPRRNRVSPGIRRLVRETSLTPADLVLPLFVQEGKNARSPIASLEGHARLSIDLLVQQAERAYKLGVPGVVLFPAIDNKLKNSKGTESLNPKGLMQRAISAVKDAVPDLVVFTDVALDPYSSDGHDGVLVGDKVDNDRTVPLLAAMAVAQARAGADIVAPSDMMDGRVGAIRDALDEEGFVDVGICAYCTKYASAFYGPFRDALDSSPRKGDKNTYQMDPGNVRECLREIELDEGEGADMLMVKPGLPYLDVVKFVRENSSLPIAAYHVSGEFAMLKAAAEKGYLDYDRCLLETLTSFKRAGADIIFTYAALEAAELLRRR